VGILRDERRANPWLEVAFGVVLAAPVALIMSQIEQAEFRTGALAVAFVVVVGLAITWRAALGASPVLFVGAWFQDGDKAGDVPSARHLVGLLLLALSFAVVVFALKRWEGDRRRAREAAAAVSRNERRLIALVDFAQQLAAVPDRPGVMRVVADDVIATADANGAILVNEGRNRVEFLVVAGHDPTAFPRETPPEYLTTSSPALDVLRSGDAVFAATRDEFVERYPGLEGYARASGHLSWAAMPVPGIGALVMAWTEPQSFGRAQRAFLVTLGNLIGAAAQRVEEVTQSELQRFVGAFDAMLDGVGIHRAIRDASGRIVDFEIEYMNPSSVNLPRDRTEIVGRRLQEVWPESPLLEQYARVVDSGEPFLLEEADTGSLGGGNDNATIVSVRASRLDPDRMVLVVRDVSERAALLREIQDANLGFTVAQELARVGSWRYDFATDRLEWSDELYRICGMERGDPLPRPADGGLFEFEHPDDRGRVQEAIRDAVMRRAPFAFDVKIVRRNDRDVRDVATSGMVLTGEQDEITAIWGATQDVTERRRSERMRREMVSQLVRTRMVVSELQQVLLPAEMPEVDGAVLTAHYRAATIEEVVGGDWYDAFDGPDGRVYMVVGDVAGHGIGCATLANQLRIAIQVRVNDGRRLGDILDMLDGELADEFATCWLGAYDAESRVLRVANAGHMPAVLYRDGRCEFVAAHTRPPLGSGFGGVDEVELPLEPGDVLVAFTDGLVERRSEPIEVGLDRLCAVLADVGNGEDVGLALVARLAADSQDDVCVMTLRVQPNGVDAQAG
jgi:serine phosphatase RsbU (regulator of sigma subunit)/PAS domain-containing protein